MTGGIDASARVADTLREERRRGGGRLRVAASQ
jgi:hypothetical protein